MVKEYIRRKIRKLFDDEIDVQDEDICFFIYIYLMLLSAAIYSLIVSLKYYYNIDIIDIILNELLSLLDS